MKRRLGNLVILLSGLIFGVILLETGLRIVKISYPNFYTLDEHRGYAHRPGAEGWYTKEGKSYIRINRDGLRDREHTREKPKNTIRIAVLGDSYAEAFQLPMEKAFWALMGEELGACKYLNGREVEVINFGVSGYGTAQELLTLRHIAWKYSPDIVVLAFVPGNDIRNNSLKLESDRLRPYFVRQDGKLVPDMSFRNSPSFTIRQTLLAKTYYAIKNYSRVLQTVGEVKQNLKMRQRIKQRKELASNILHEEIGLDSAVYIEPVDDVWQEAWRTTEDLLKLTWNEVKSKDASLLVVTVTGAIQVHKDPRVRQEFMQKLGVKDLSYPNQRIRALGEQEGFPVLNLAEPFLEYAEKNQIFLHGFGTGIGWGHWNAEGHRLAGEIIAQKICDDLIHR